MAMLWLSIVASAYDFEVDGIYYLADVSDMTATVTSGDNPYDGDLVIPETTSYKGREFVVTSIASQTFYNCTGLESVALPKSITNIGTEAFKNCSSLKSFKIPQNVTNLPTGCFRECTSLCSIDMQSSSQLEHIDEACFRGCSSLESINLPSSIVEIGVACFADCVSLASIIIPDEVNSIGSMAFLNCGNLISVSLPNTVKTLSKDLFQNCSKLAEFTIPDSVVIIEDGVLKNCSALTSISIPSAVAEIKNEVFNGCSNLREVRFEDNNDPIILGYGRSKEDGTPRGIFNGIPVEKLYLGRDLSYSIIDECIVTNLAYGQIYEGYAPFVYCGLTEVVISNSVSQINPFTFYGCEKLEQIEIPNSVKSIGICAFARSGIISFTVQNGFSSLSMGVTKNGNLTTIFMGCPNMEIVKIGRNLVVSDKPYIGADNWRIPNLWGTLFPPTVTSVEIGNYVKEMSFLQLNNDYISESLVHYPNLKRLKIGYSILSIPSLEENSQLSLLTLCSTTPVEIIDNPFSSGEGFTNSQYMDLEVEVPIDSKSKYEGTEVWRKFWNLKGVHDLHSNIVVDDDWTYGLIDESNNIELFKIPDEIYTDVYIPEKVIQDGKIYVVKSIGNVFTNNSDIISIDIPETVEYLDPDCFKDCKALESVDLKSGLKRVGANALQNCVSLNHIDLKDGLESIGANAFDNCHSLQHIALKDGLRSIGAKAFNNCTSLKTLSIPSSVDVFGEAAFDKCEFDSLRFEDGDKGLEFPHKDYTSYSAPGGWSYFYTYKGYFSTTSIRNLYLGRNIINIPNPYVYENKLTYYNVFEDPFYNVPNLESIAVGLNVSKIGSDVTEPINSGRDNNYRSFGGCKDIQTVKVQGENPPINAIFSKDAYSQATLYVPENTIALYQDAEGWKEFNNIFDGTESILVDEITLNVNELSLEIGDTYQLTADFFPEDASDQTVIWESSNADCVTVDENGLLTALSEGSATIVARSADGNCEASCLVTVTSELGSVDAIGLCPRGVYIIYNLQGIKILESEDVDKVKQLPSGVYIVNGKKLIIK